MSLIRPESLGVMLHELLAGHDLSRPGSRSLAPFRIAAQEGKASDRLMDVLWRDFLVALRQFRRRPTFVLAVVSTLTLAIGANITVFSVVNAVLLRALPFHEPERLVWIASVRPDNPAGRSPFRSSWTIGTAQKPSRASRRTQTGLRILPGRTSRKDFRVPASPPTRLTCSA